MTNQPCGCTYDGQQRIFPCAQHQLEHQFFTQKAAAVSESPRKGWICPRCNRVWAPQVAECMRCNVPEGK